MRDIYTKDCKWDCPPLHCLTFLTRAVSRRLSVSSGVSDCLTSAILERAISRRASASSSVSSARETLLALAIGVLLPRLPRFFGGIFFSFFFSCCCFVTTCCHHVRTAMFLCKTSFSCDVNSQQFVLYKIIIHFVITSFSCDVNSD